MGGWSRSSRTTTTSAFPKDTQALVLTEIDGIDALLDAQQDEIIEISRRNNATGVESSADPATRAKLWKARKSAFGAIGKISPSYCTQDACVPRSQLAKVLARVDEIGKAYRPADQQRLPRRRRQRSPDLPLRRPRRSAGAERPVAAEEILKYCIDVGGTLTGEHGVGVEKIHLMPYLFDGRRWTASSA
jgi:glycolate oxidase